MAGLSVIIPSYNSELWLPTTINYLVKSLQNSSWDSEIIVVDDGSTDNTSLVLSEMTQANTFPLQVVTQTNQGRFLARWAGIQAASKEYLLLLDSRVLLDPDSLRNVETEIVKKDRDFIWNGFVKTDAQASLPGLFWDVPTRIFWGDFLSNPRPVNFGVENFDRYPKGTGCLLLKTSLLRDSYEEVWPEGDFALVSDDTRLLRNLVTKADIVLDPKFSAIYRPRVNFSSFISHTFTRGTLFVDSYAGTSLFRRVFIGIAALSPLLFILLAFFGQLHWELCALVALLFAPAIIGAVRKASAKAVASYLLLAIPFGLLFWAGITRGIWVHRRHFLPGKSKSK